MLLNKKIKTPRHGCNVNQPVALDFILQAAPPTLHGLLVLLDGALVLPSLEQLVALLHQVGLLRLGLVGSCGERRNVRLLAGVRVVRVDIVTAPAPTL